MVRNSKFDLIIIGGGTAAFSAVIKANMHEVKTAMIERGNLGGTCVNVGCIPSKNLLGAGDIMHSSKEPSYSSIFPCDSNLALCLHRYELLSVIVSLPEFLYIFLATACVAG